MIARVCSFLAGVALIGAPALAGMPASWTRADLPQGHGTIATPCSDDERVAVSDRTIYCQADGVTFVVDISTAAIFMNGEYREMICLPRRRHGALSKTILPGSARSVATVRQAMAASAWGWLNFALISC